MAEAEQAHRHAVELKAIEIQAKDMGADRVERNRGQMYALILCTTLVAGGCAVAIVGQGWPGAAIVSVGMTGIITAFIYGRATEAKQAQSGVSEATAKADDRA